MKIDNVNKKVAELRMGTLPLRTEKSTDKPLRAFDKTPSDSVTLSLQGQSQTDGTDRFNAQKVNEIKAAIASGQFKVNVEKVADGLLANVKDILGQASSRK